MVDVGLLQSLSYVAAAIGVCVAAIYYVMMLRNNEKIRRRDFVFQRLQASQLQLYEAYGTVMYQLDWNNFEEFRDKYMGKPEVMSKVWYVLTHYNSLGILFKEGLASPEQIFQQEQPVAIINLYERYKPEIVVSRLTPSMEVHNPDSYKGFELLYQEAKRRYPKTPVGPFSKEVLVGHARRVDELLKKEACTESSPSP